VLGIKWYISAPVYADDVNTSGGSLYTTKQNKEALVVADKQICLEVNAEKTCMAIP
jgi:hypothetical protein